MKKITKILAVTAVLAISVGASVHALAAPQISASIQINARADFEAPLAPEGAWINVGTYGRCWHPHGIAGDWRPYCNGQWVWTDCGWYWDSDEPWAWACYHYGTWVDDPEIGWCWVPDIEWAPAWVEWRVGGDYIGWAPCAPVGVVVAPGLFAFVVTGHFHDHIERSAVVFNNPTIINRTTRIAEFKHETRTIDGRQQRVAINDGPGVAAIEKATGRKETATPVQNVLHARTVVRDAKPNERPTETRPEQRPTSPDRRDLPDSTTRSRESTPPNREPVTRPAQPAQTPVERPVTPPAQERHVTPVSPRQPWSSPSRPSAPPARPVVPTPRPTPTPQPEKPVAPPRESKPEAVPHEEKPAVPPGGNEKDKGRGRDGGGGQVARRPSSHIEIV